MTQITKTTLKDAIIDADLWRLHLSRGTNTAGDDLVAEIFNPKDVESLRNRWSSTHSVALLDATDINAFWSEFTEKVAQSKILDTDKVFFTKSSIFPRSSFNRYSEKARLVQTTKAATKYAVSDTLVRELGNTSFTLYLFEKTTSANTSLKAYVDINTDNAYDALHYASSGALTTTHKIILKQMKGSRWNTPVTDGWFKMVERHLNEKYEVTGDWTVVKKDVKILTANTIKEKETAPFLLSGEIELEDFVNDTEVNSYIDRFKGEFDDSMYDYLYSTLSASTSDPEVPMQLLTNMKIDLGNPRLDALFINLESKAKSNIINHRVMRTVDVKNFVKTHSLHNLLDYYSGSNVQSRMQLLAQATNKYTNNEDRQKLFELTRSELEKMVNNEFAMRNIKISMKYEEVREPDGTGSEA